MKGKANTSNPFLKVTQTSNALFAVPKIRQKAKARNFPPPPPPSTGSIQLQNTHSMTASTLKLMYAHQRKDMFIKVSKKRKTPREKCSI